MGEYDIYKNLNDNMVNLDDCQNEMARVELAIFHKTVEELTVIKLDEIKRYFEQQAVFYGQKMSSCQKEIDKNIEKYKFQLYRNINAYNSLFISVFRILESALNNQKIAVANIVTLKQKLKRYEENSEEWTKTRNMIIACAEKKLNYAVMVDECNARIKWCIENVKKDINEVFENDIYKLQVYDAGFVQKIKRFFSNKFFGKEKFKNVVNSYENDYLKSIENENEERILNVAVITGGVNAQMEEVQKQISQKYNERLCA